MGVSEDAVRAIADYSGGHPFIIQVIGLFAYEEAVNGTGSIVVGTVQKVLPRVMSRLEAQVFRDRFQAASRIEREVLLAMASIGKIDVTPLGIAANMTSATERKSLRSALKRLAEKECLVKKERGMCSFFTPLFGEYVKGRMMPTT